MEIKLKDLLEAGCHFGHQANRWNPKMKNYIFTARDNVHIFDLVKTKDGLEQTAAFAKAMASQGGKIVFVGTKRQAKDIIKQAALRVGMPYVSERWIGGTITNWEVIKKNIDKLKDLKAKKEAGEFKNYTKKENLLIDREIARLEQMYGGIADLEKLPQAIFVVDVKKEFGAVKEASEKGVKVIGVVDTNSDPTLADYVIPANDDATKSIELIVNYIAEAVEEGKAAYAKASASQGKEKKKTKKKAK